MQNRTWWVRSRDSQKKDGEGGQRAKERGGGREKEEEEERVKNDTQQGKAKRLGRRCVDTTPSVKFHKCPIRADPLSLPNPPQTSPPNQRDVLVQRMETILFVCFLTHWFWCVSFTWKPRMGEGCGGEGGGVVDCASVQ